MHRALPAVAVVAVHGLVHEHEIEGEDPGEQRDPSRPYFVQEDGAEAEGRRQQIASLNV